MNGSTTDSASQRPRVVVVGGGIAGLATAFRLLRLADDASTSIDLTLLESSDRVGGTIETARHDGLTMERGPDSMITDKPWGVELCEELGLGDRLLPTSPDHRGSFIARGGSLHRVPEGFHLMAPSRMWPFLTSRLLSVPGKLRMAADLVIPPRRDDGESDESLAAFVRRRLGREALERVAQPMVGGIYTADPERLSLRATMPRFLDMERKHGSVIRAMVAGRRALDAVGTARGPRYELFVAFRDGMEELPRRLLERLPGGSVRLGCPVDSIARDGERWCVSIPGESIVADAVCVAAPAHAAARMLRDAAPELATEVAAIEYASTATVNLTCARKDIAHPLDGFGFVVPASEGRATLACSFSSVKYAGRAPQGRVLLRAFVGGALSPQRFELDDRAMIAAVLADLRELVGLRGEPHETLVSRYPQAMPQYHVGHLDRMARIDGLLARLPRLEVTGSGYRGTGIPDCIRGANEAAARLLCAVGAA